MCVVAVKYIEGSGWIGIKNRDRNYKPTIKIRKSFRNGIERLYIWDMRTRWTEGLNEHGICVISGSVLVKDDEAEGAIARRVANKQKLNDGTFFSPDGKKIRTALLEDTVEKAFKSILDSRVSGNTYVFDRNRCFLLEGQAVQDEDGNPTGEFESKWIEISKDKISVRTNHGILLPHTGYQIDPEDPSSNEKRESSVIRRQKVSKALRKAKTTEDMWNALSITDDKNPQLNPLRIDSRRGKDIMKTTGQLLLEPSANVLHYRPIWCETLFDFQKLNGKKEKTYFEISSSKNLFTFKEYVDIYGE